MLISTNASQKNGDLASAVRMSVYEKVQLVNMTWDAEQLMYFYTCPCGDLFEISLEELHDGEDIAPCPSCSLKIRVLYDEADLPPLEGPYPKTTKKFANTLTESGAPLSIENGAVIAALESDND